MPTDMIHLTGDQLYLIPHYGEVTFRIWDGLPSYYPPRVRTEPGVTFQAGPWRSDPRTFTFTGPDGEVTLTCTTAPKPAPEPVPEPDPVPEPQPDPPPEPDPVAPPEPVQDPDPTPEETTVQDTDDGTDSLADRAASAAINVPEAQVIDALTAAGSELEWCGLDTTYKAVSTVHLAEFLDLDQVNTGNYLAESWDCDNFAVAFTASANQVLGNSVGVMVDVSASHAYNAVLTHDDGAVRVVFVEPQTDEIGIQHDMTSGFVVWP